MNNLPRISDQLVNQLIDFNPNGKAELETVANYQRKATVATFNMLAMNKFSYLADEVGMGKTYVALAVINLMRYLNPNTKVVIITPRKNIQWKWKKELENFVGTNWKIIANRVKSLDSTPVWKPVICNNLAEFAHEALLDQDRDFILRNPSFSLRANQWEYRKAYRTQLCKSIRSLKESDIDIENTRDFLESYGVALNAAVPQADLVVVDEAHNLRHGFGPHVSNRNKVLGTAFGNLLNDDLKKHWFESKATRILFLSATPFEDDYGAIKRQAAVFGFQDQEIHCVEGNGNVAILDDANEPDLKKRELLANILIRRTASLQIGNQRYTKNMYRREWRKGGLQDVDASMRIEDVKTRLVLALVQKKVSEVLNDEKLNNSFQIGMLSSFESFAESMENQSNFDDTEQQRKLEEFEKKGVDTNAVREISNSYLKRFRKALPHPKQDMLTEKLKNVFDTGEKSLIFVRRVATVAEIKRRLCQHFDEWMKHKFHESLPDMRRQIEDLFECYQFEKNDNSTVEEQSDEGNFNDELQVLEKWGEIDDDGGDGNFFEWYFRGDGPSRYLAGEKLRARFQANGAYSTVFEDNYLSWLLNCKPSSILDRLSIQTGINSRELIGTMNRLATEYYLRNYKDIDSSVYRTFEAYQVAGLKLLCCTDTDLKSHAEVVLHQKYGETETNIDSCSEELLAKPQRYLKIQTLFTELRRSKYQNLKERIWPDESTCNFLQDFRRQEQRRELVTSLSLLGRSYIDLYLLAIMDIGSFILKSGTKQQGEGRKKLVQAYIRLLQQQSKSEKFNAFYELSQVAENFEVIIHVNFPDIDQHHLSELPRYFGRILGAQEPVGGVSGQTNNRLVAQFRMPGFPIVLASTDVLQEGEDLHTFCKNIFHYGIAWNPSAIEQRIGRIDRIGGLVQRIYGKWETEPEKFDEHKIQVYYPYLSDTVERLQVEKVLERLNKFVRLVHEDLRVPSRPETSIDLNKEIHVVRDIEPITEELTSAFEINDHWLKGQPCEEIKIQDVSECAKQHFLKLCMVLGIQPSPVKWNEALYPLKARKFRYPTFEDMCHLKVKSHVAGEQMILQCEHFVAKRDLEDSYKLERLVECADKVGDLRLCIDHRVERNLDRIFVRNEILFDPDSSDTEWKDVKLMIEKVAESAVKLFKLLAK